MYNSETDKDKNLKKFMKATFNRYKNIKKIKQIKNGRGKKRLISYGMPHIYMCIYVYNIYYSGLCTEEI